MLIDFFITIVFSLLTNLGAILAFRLLTLYFWKKNTGLRILNTLLLGFLLVEFWFHLPFMLDRASELDQPQYVISIFILIFMNMATVLIIFKMLEKRDKGLLTFYSIHGRVTKEQLIYFLLALVVVVSIKSFSLLKIVILNTESQINLARFITWKSLKILYYASWEEVLRYFLLFSLIRIVDADVDQRGNAALFVILAIINAVMHYHDLTLLKFFYHFVSALFFLWGQKRFEKIYFACIIHFISNALLFVLYDKYPF